LNNSLHEDFIAYTPYDTHVGETPTNPNYRGMTRITEDYCSNLGKETTVTPYMRQGKKLVVKIPVTVEFSAWR
jgi:hypothetical protein